MFLKAVWEMTSAESHRSMGMYVKEKDHSDAYHTKHKRRLGRGHLPVIEPRGQG